MLATLTKPKSSMPYFDEEHDTANDAVNLDINENGQITLPKWLLEKWGIGVGSQITLIPKILHNTTSETKRFDETQSLSVAELMQSVGVTTDKKATIEQMDEGVKKLFANWED